MRMMYVLIMICCAWLTGCLPSEPVDPAQTDQHTLIIFHNGTGPMCIDALAWLDNMKAAHPGLVVEERLVTSSEDRALLEELKADFNQSQGVSSSFGYLPIIFFHDEAFSGFSDDIAQSLQALLESY